MLRLTHHELENLLTEDVPYHDLSTEAIGASGTSTITYFTRDPGVVCGTEEVARLASLLDLRVTESIRSGERVEPGGPLLSGEGDTEAIFELWKVGQNILDRCSGIATAARNWRDRLDEAGYDLPVLVTRKVFPGAKKLMTKAAIAGGLVPHRLGVSETILFFDQHIDAAGGRQGFLAVLPKVKRTHIEKKIIVETSEPGFAEEVLAAGADGIQFEKLPPADVASCVAGLRSRFPDAVLIVAGGVTLDNCVDYAAAGVDGLVTSAVYQARPLDIGVRISRR